QRLNILGPQFFTRDSCDRKRDGLQALLLSSGGDEYLAVVVPRIGILRCRLWSSLRLSQGDRRPCNGTDRSRSNKRRQQRPRCGNSVHSPIPSENFSIPDWLDDRRRASKAACPPRACALDQA